MVKFYGFGCVVWLRSCLSSFEWVLLYQGCVKVGFVCASVAKGIWYEVWLQVLCTYAFGVGQQGSTGF
jgi:hypothetical protein